MGCRKDPGGVIRTRKNGPDAHDSKIPRKAEEDRSVSQPNYIHSPVLKVSYVAMVQCLRCRTRVSVEVTAEELRRLRASERLHRRCDQCGQETAWQYLPLGVSR